MLCSYKAMPIRTKRRRHIRPELSGITGVILAGGKSSRYGKNKAFEKVNGVPLIERVIEVVGSVFEDLLLITNAPDEYGYLNLPMVQDLIKGLGPLGGIYTGLNTISGDAGFFVACDMPFLNAALVRHISELRSGFDAVVPRVGWMIEPLHALYTKGCIDAVKVMIDAHEYQFIKFFDRVRIRYIEEDELRAIDLNLRSFLNVNRREDLSKIMRSGCH